MNAAPMIHLPEAGYYRTKMVRGGPWCAVFIWHGPTPDPETGEPLDRSPHWQATVNGAEIDVWNVWPFVSDKRIEREEYDYLMALSKHAKTHAPEMPEAEPTKRIDFNRTKPVF